MTDVVLTFVAPARAVNASLLDMGRFLNTEIRQGIAPNGKRAVSTASLRKLGSRRFRCVLTIQIRFPTY